MRLLAK